MVIDIINKNDLITFALFEEIKYILNNKAKVTFTRQTKELKDKKAKSEIIRNMTKEYILEKIGNIDNITNVWLKEKDILISFETVNVIYDLNIKLID